MIGITSKAEMIERLKDILAVENLAKNSYEKDLTVFEDEELSEQIFHIIKQEEEHIFMLKETIALLESENSDNQSI